MNDRDKLFHKFLQEHNSPNFPLLLLLFFQRNRIFQLFQLTRPIQRLLLPLPTEQRKLLMRVRQAQAQPLPNIFIFESISHLRDLSHSRSQNGQQVALNEEDLEFDIVVGDAGQGEKTKDYAGEHDVFFESVAEAVFEAGHEEGEELGDKRFFGFCFIVFTLIL